jgi:hypothetical protein
MICCNVGVAAGCEPITTPAARAMCPSGGRRTQPGQPRRQGPGGQPQAEETKPDVNAFDPTRSHQVQPLSCPKAAPYQIGETLYGGTRCANAAQQKVMMDDFMRTRQQALQQAIQQAANEQPYPAHCNNLPPGLMRPECPPESYKPLNADYCAQHPQLPGCEALLGKQPVQQQPAQQQPAQQQPKECPPGHMFCTIPDLDEMVTRAMQQHKQAMDDASHSDNLARMQQWFKTNRPTAKNPD